MATLAPAVSPLTEADPASLNHLIAERIDAIFNKEPPYSDADLLEMVKYYRESRARFAANAAATAIAPKAKTKAKSEAKSEAKPSAPATDLDEAL